MKILDRIDNKTLTRKYENIIAWGTGPLFERNYQTYYFPIKAVVDGRYEGKGQFVKGVIPVIVPEDLLGWSEKKTIIVSYSIYEEEICSKIYEDLKLNVDFVIFSMIDIIVNDDIRAPLWFAKNFEDVACVGLFNDISNGRTPRVMEIGVCHPVIRNNTYLFNLLYRNNPCYEEVLVEANPLCWKTIEEYRSNAKLVKKGVCIHKSKKTLPFYVFPSLMGHSTFDRELAEKKRRELGFDFKEVIVPTTTINDVLEENYERGDSPDILSIDVEGLDYDIIKQIDFNKRKIKILIIEIMREHRRSINEIMKKNGYVMRFKNDENEIWTMVSD